MSEDIARAKEEARKAAAAEFSARGAWLEPDRDDLNGAISSYEAALGKTHVLVPREPSVDALNAVLRTAVSDIAMMHVTGRINAIEAQTRQEMAEREARRIYRAMITEAERVS